MPEDDETFLARWSRRKRAAAKGELAAPEAGPDDAATPANDAELVDEDNPHASARAEEERAQRLAELEGKVEALDFNSDYTGYMGREVPEELRNKALRKLWLSDPILANQDGLDHYIDDYTDEAVAVPMGALKTAYKFGQGFLSDAEAAEWERLGRPDPPAAASPAASDISIAQERADQPEVLAFFAASEAYMSALYPAESNHFVDPAFLDRDNVVFLVARHAGAAVGCGGVVIGEAGGADTGELKRMWVVPARRGGRLGRRLLEALEAAARARGVRWLRLETGIHQPEATGLYRAAGYVERGPFGGYGPDPLSLFMEKDLVGASAGDITPGGAGEGS